MNAIDASQRLRRPVPEAVFQALQTRFGTRFSRAQAVCEHHGRDESPYPVMAPDAVVFAENTDDVVFVAQLCNQHGVPLIPYGAGSSLEGHTLAIEGGISLDVSRMDQVVSVNPEDLTATVQAGVTRKALNEHIRDTGLFFPIDPGADASLGGMAATRASGTNAVRYGTMRENVVALTVVTADGRVVRTAGRARKSSAGYDLTRIFVGSEGTLGIIVEVTVAGMLSSGNAGPGQGIIVGALAIFASVHGHRESNVWNDAAVLGTAAIRQEKLACGDLDLTKPRNVVIDQSVKAEQVLHRAFAEAGLADHDAAPIILDGTCENLRGRSRAAIDKDSQRAIPDRMGIAVFFQEADPATGFAHLDDNATVNE